MTDIINQPPKYFRAPVSRGGDPRVDRNGGYRGAGIIRGVSVITKGEALGHGLWIDDVTLQQVESLINANKLGVKSRWQHPTASGDALGKHVGRIMDAEVDGDQVFADQHFVPSAHKSPAGGDLAGYLMDLSIDDPSAYGISIAFLHDQNSMEQFVEAHSVDGEFRSPEPNNISNYPHVRILEIHSADSVDSPAANSGLFHREGDIAREAEAFVSYALGRTNERPDTQFGLDPDRARGFMARYFDTHSLSIKELEMAEQPVEPSTEQQPTVLQIQVGSRVKVKAGMEHDAEHAGMVGTIGEMSTPAFGVRWDSMPDVLHKWYTEAELEATDEAPAEPAPEAPETEASDQSEAKRFAEAFGEQAVVWHFIEGLTFDECRARQLESLRSENEQLKTKLATRPLDGEDSPVSFDTNERKRNGFASNYRIK